LLLLLLLRCRFFLAPFCTLAREMNSAAALTTIIIIAAAAPIFFFVFF